MKKKKMSYNKGGKNQMMKKKRKIKASRQKKESRPS